MLKPLDRRRIVDELTYDLYWSEVWWNATSIGHTASKKVEGIVRAGDENEEDSTLEFNILQHLWNSTGLQVTPHWYFRIF